MNVVPSLVEGYMYSEMLNLNGGEKLLSGGYPIDLVDHTDHDISVGGGGKAALKHLVIPIGLVCVNRSYPSLDCEVERPNTEMISDTLLDTLYDRVSNIFVKPSKRKTMKNKKQQ
jgi:hypothetical protein